MRVSFAELYSPGEVARAVTAGGRMTADERDVRRALAALGLAHDAPYIAGEDAVQAGRLLAEQSRTATRIAARRGPLFAAVCEPATERRPLVPLALSSTLHAGIGAVLVFVASFNLAPRAATLVSEDRPSELMRMVFLQTPGPGGGGGGGGLQQKPPAPKAMREGARRLSSPLPAREEPKPIVPVPTPPEPKPAPPLKAEQLPVVVAPIVTAPADPRTRIGVLEQTTAESDSHGAGKGGGAGTGTGTGLGSGDGSGIGPGSGGGIGGGPYRPGSGIQPPRLVREVKADYTEEARQRSVAGEVVLEIVVRRDGSVGDVKILQGLGGGLNERAVQAVRQWRFTPAQRLGSPVDVIVEVAVEFRLR